MSKEDKNTDKVGNDTIHSVMPRIDHFIDKDGYMYECWDESIIIKITSNGYLEFSILLNSFDEKPRKLKPIYVA